MDEIKERVNKLMQMSSKEAKKVSSLISENGRLKPSVLYLSYGNADLWPPVFNSAKFFSDAGFTVRIVCFYRGQDYNVDYGSNTKVFRLDKVGEPYPTKLLSKLKGLATFLKASLALCAKEKPDLIIVDGIHSFFVGITLRWIYRKRLLYFCIDFRDIRSCGKLDRWLKVIEHLFAKYSDLVVTLDNRRAAALFERNRLKSYPLVALNCQPLGGMPAIQPKKRDILKRDLKKVGIDAQKTIIRSGAINENGGIESTMKALLGLPSEVVLILCGRPEASYKEKLTALCAEMNLENRVILFDNLPYDKWTDYLFSADIGHMLEEPVYLSEFNSPVGTTRPFLYLRAGIPQLASSDPDMKQFVEENQCGICVSKIDSTEIRDAIKRMLEDDQYYAELSRNSYEAFVQRFNFEAQFQPVLERILDLLSDAGATAASDAGGDCRRRS